MTITPDSVVSRRADLPTVELDGETMLMHVESGAYFGLSKTSQDIWQRLESPVAVRDLCAALAAAYDAPYAAIAKDVVAFLDQLESHGLLVVAPGGA